MSWLALLLLGVAVTDLTFSATRRPWAGQAAGAAAVVAVALLAGLTAAADVVAWLLLAGLVAAWGATVTVGFGRRHAALPLTLLGVGVAATLATAGAAGPVAGPLASWLEGLPWLDADPDGALLVAGALLAQLVTGNVVVRLVLQTSGTANPAGPGALKGGRLLGPMERLAIVGLGLAGELAAAGVVVAAKGLLRFPELQAARRRPTPGSDIHDVTEYFLVGSFVSWSVALASLAVLA